MTAPSTPGDISGRVVDALYLSDPELDTSIGTPLRKIIDAISVQIADTSSGSYLTNYAYDIDSKVGGDLDDFCANFGIARLPGARASGTLTFSRSSAIAANSAVIIGPGTQAITGTIPTQTFQTTISSTMDVGQTSIDVPAQALDEGPDANILANTPLRLGTSIVGVTSVSNATGFIGGSIDETDAQLRARFKSTVFRNLAGTDQMYRGIALQTLSSFNAGSYSVAQVNILGAANHNVEQVQISSNTASASLTTSAYFVASSVVITDSNGKLYAPRTQYNVTVNNAANPATLSITTNGAAVGMPDGIYNLEYDYIAISSRNDPFNTRWGQGIVNNRIDVIVNGLVAAGGIQTAAYVNTVTFNNTTGNALLRTKFVNPAGVSPANGDVFIPLGFGPILTLPTSISWPGAPSEGALLGTHYDIIHQDDAFGYAPSSLFGIWWKTSTNGSTYNPPNNTQFTIGNTTTQNSDGTTTTTGYTYNSVPATVQSNIANWRLLGTDVQVHAGRQALLAFNFAIVYDRNVNVTTVNTNVQNALGTFLATLGFNAAVQVSDVVQVVHNVQGVDNVRLLASTDSTTYGIQRVQSNGTVIQTYNVSGRPTDVYFDERTYPVLASIAFTPKARNTFRS